MNVSATQIINVKCQPNLGICVIHDEIEKTDYNLADRLRWCCGKNKVPLLAFITSASMIYAAMDNFDLIRNVKFGKDSSHDTNMLFLNNNNKENTYRFSVTPTSQAKSIYDSRIETLNVRDISAIKENKC